MPFHLPREILLMVPGVRAEIDRFLRKKRACSNEQMEKVDIRQNFFTECIDTHIGEEVFEIPWAILSERIRSDHPVMGDAYYEEIFPASAHAFTRTA